MNQISFNPPVRGSDLAPPTDWPSFLAAGMAYSQCPNDLGIHVDRALFLTGELIRHRSLSGQEGGAAECLIGYLSKRLDGQPKRLPVGDGSFNVMLSWGVPSVIFTTHIDVVTAPDALFEPQFTSAGVRGRGACDAKGCIAAMVEAAVLLRARNEGDFALLFVVGEEQDGRGARAAAAQLKGQGIEYIVNGEPTDGKLVTAHKGLVNMRMRFWGKAAHSAYPELGIDAHEKAVLMLERIYQASKRRQFGEHPTLGATTVNAILQGYGVDGKPLADASIVCPYAEIQLKFRSVVSGDDLKGLVAHISGLSEQLTEAQDGWTVEKAHEPVSMLSFEGFETGVANYSTDLPHFQPLGAQGVLFGPGASALAHTDHEFISGEDLAAGISGYLWIYDQLKARRLFAEDVCETID